MAAVGAVQATLSDLCDCRAAALNMAIFLLIGKTSALTMNIAGVAKDWMLIGLSVWLYQCAPSPPSSVCVEPRRCM